MAGFSALMGRFLRWRTVILRVKEVSFLPEDPLLFNNGTKSAHRPLEECNSRVVRPGTVREGGYVHPYIHLGGMVGGMVGGYPGISLGGWRASFRLFPLSSWEAGGPLFVTFSLFLGGWRASFRHILHCSGRLEGLFSSHSPCSGRPGGSLLSTKTNSETGGRKRVWSTKPTVKRVVRGVLGVQNQQ